MQTLIPTSFHTWRGHEESDAMQHEITSFAQSVSSCFLVLKCRGLVILPKHRGTKRNKPYLSMRALYRQFNLFSGNMQYLMPCILKASKNAGDRWQVWTLEGTFQFILYVQTCFFFLLKVHLFGCKGICKTSWWVCSIYQTSRTILVSKTSRNPSTSGFSLLSMNQ